MSSLPLFAEFEETELPEFWDSNDWETPNSIAQSIARLVLPTDRLILEPAAGTGQIARQIPINNNRTILAIEVSHSRFVALQANCRSHFINSNRSDFLLWPDDPQWHLVVTNPPFSLALEFIERSLAMLDRSYEHARLLYLLPCDVFHGVDRGNRFKHLDCHIHHRYLIQNRVPYLKNGKAFKGRKVYDCVYDVRLGKAGATESYL